MFKVFSPSELLKPTPCIILWFVASSLVADYYYAYFDYAIWIGFIVIGIWIGEAWQKSKQKLLINMTSLEMLESDGELRKSFYEMRKFIFIKKIIKFIGFIIFTLTYIYFLAFVFIPIPMYIGKLFLNLNPIFNNWYLKIPGLMFLAGISTLICAMVGIGVFEAYKKIKDKFLNGKGLKIKEFLARLNKLESELEKLK